MKVPLRWFSEYVDTGLTVNELAHRLTMAGLEAEKISVIGDVWDKIYVGHVEAVERHPDADRLVLAMVDAGEHRLQVVTGAPNIAVGDKGQKVILGLSGTSYFDGHATPKHIKELKPSTLRGAHESLIGQPLGSERGTLETTTFHWAREAMTSSTSQRRWAAPSIVLSGPSGWWLGLRYCRVSSTKRSSSAPHLRRR